MPSKPNTADMNVICDIDGTLAHMGDRRTPLEWDKVHLDSYDPYVGYLLSLHREMNDTIIIVSGREDVCREATVQWLNQHGVYYNRLFMRAAKDFRPDTIVKKEIWETRILPTYPSITQINTIVYDDRDSVVKMWREELGLKVFQVAPGNF